MSVDRNAERYVAGVIRRGDTRARLRRPAPVTCGCELWGMARMRHAARHQACRRQRRLERTREVNS